MKTGVRAKCQGRETRTGSNVLGSSLIDRDVALGHSLRLFGFDPAEKRMHGEMSAFDSVIQIGKNAEVIFVPLKRLQQLWKLKIPTALAGEKLLGIHAKRIPYTNHLHSSVHALFGFCSTQVVI